ncbi:23S rRNA (pseudouridine1915-N3)-methyltransferase [Jannaschia faecimaris]|uniref:Ribosomal RNA large subunit methyltransferase H n=1 Tax=Jannaschia faecimaris TaxID=1244108 RepID=A0A1H3J708_9RHOB|nr:23S rRNA (pseudouridine(1915)-N(3))-methyltransferase RlmH [Jannaschia faecimaris]SDY34974.1 23S rRNA (pseudouridine1915-N3)-methyltransferase [Jannaschia faecimaris]
MKIHLICVGRLRKGPEKVMVEDYLDRFAKAGRGLGLPPVMVNELDARGGGMEAERELIAKAIPSGAALVVFDERGRHPTSPEFAADLGSWRDEARDVALVIGGADGLSPCVRDRADLAISLGAMVWPHMLVRVMVAEQLYRAASILAGSPYHRV